ncbi:hypothetical protein SAMN05444372_102138 [Flavobacterium micromati]|uniref:FUSC family protein n=1 Tax=Flavobacterium micromati TaxID=229205 RepID=A0A1M5GSP7_9FLAO|nr:hypothetical protein [Flavobacterium micromati]SHG06820.1 hypothetical protein SAMN05444372_102138 [Flavobacterium micromati]
MEHNDLKNLTNEDLEIEFKKRKSARTFAGFYTGMFIGIAVWSTVKNGFGLLTFLPILVSYFFRKTSTNYNEIKQEMAIRKSTL